MTNTRRTKLQLLVATPLAFLLAVGGALAYWSSTSDAGGNGASAATSVNQGATPTVSRVGGAVTVAWAVRTLGSGVAVSGYQVKRYDVATGTSQTMLSACTGTIVALTCIESNLPAGSWQYTVTPVFATNWRGVESAVSTVINYEKVAPANAISLTAITTSTAGMVGNTIYYKGSTGGNFRLMNAVTDAGSGPASSATATLGGTSTGWAHTGLLVSTPAGGPYTSNTFTWASATVTSPTEVVTGRDADANAVTTTLTFINDSTAPTAGSISYLDGYQPGLSVPITFTSGTDSGSGIATRKLQRKSAPLSTAGVCGTYTAFVTIGLPDPTSVYTDRLLANSTCYMYQYVVTDVAGNVATATSVSASKISYTGAVSATTGLLSYWRLGEAAATLDSVDSFTDTAGTLVTGHTGELGATWLNPAGNSNMEISSENRLRRSASGMSIVHTTATPVSANYSVEADLHYRGAFATNAGGVIGRFNPAATSFYMARWENDNKWKIVKWSSGTPTVLGASVTQSGLTVGQTYRLRLDITGSTTTTLKLYVNGVLLVTVNDSTSPFTAAGNAGIMDGESGDAAKSATEGVQFDNFQVTPSTYPRAADSKGTNIGDYENGPILGVVGALTGDVNTGVLFDGGQDVMQVLGSTGIPTGAAARSLETWFKTSSSARQVLFRYGTVADTQAFGLSLDAGGTTMTAWGSGSGNENVFAMPYALNDGVWHQVVKTYDGTLITLFVDGVPLTAQAATRSTVMDAYGFGVGAMINPSDSHSGGFFAGTLDEVSFYTTALSTTTVTNHYQLGRSTAGGDLTGPTGGSVDGINLVGTGSRYGTSTTVSLNLNKGTDASGVAPNGALLLRASALMTSTGVAEGTCAAYSVYAVIAGGVDPLSPKFDFVTDGYCFRYQYVVPDTLGNYTTYTSPDIKFDTTVPSTPTQTFSAFTNTSSTGAVVYYRATATSGSFTSTAVSSDTKSGIASFQFAAFGTNWTSTPGALGVNTYSWSGAPAAPGARTITSTNHATKVSAALSFTPTADITAPGVGTVVYADGATSATTVSVAYTTGTDSGSGLGTKLLQRQAAPLNGITCGAFDGFATIVGGTDPISSPVVDTVAPAFCYKYQWVVADKVGNVTTATNTNTVKVTSTSPYYDMVWATAGLLNYYRLGDAPMALDTFAGTAGTSLQSRTGEIGTTWTKNFASTVDAVLTTGGRLRKDGADSVGSLYSSSGVPATPDYRVEADIYVASVVPADAIGVTGRMIEGGVLTYYLARYDQASGTWELHRVDNGFDVVVGLSAQELIAGTTYRLALDMSGTSIRVLVDGVQLISVTDANITLAGRGGVSLGFPASGATTITDAIGMHLDNFQVTTNPSSPAVDSKGTNTGEYFNGVLLAQSGALEGTTNSAAYFEGADDYASINRQVSDDLSVEFWFKSTQGIGTGSQWSSGAALVDADASGVANDFGVSLRSDGKIIAGVGNPDVSIVSSAGGYNNGSWHHVVFTRVKSTGAMVLYVDSGVAGSATGNTASLTSAAKITFARNAVGGNFYRGSLDEIAIYNVSLSAANVLAHYQRGIDATGPTGGAIDAVGLVGTGARYLTSTTVTLNFTKGSDPAGVAATGNLVQRASAALTSTGIPNGTCGPFGTYATIVGGTDPTSPKSEVVSDQFCYRYQYVVKDLVGNYTTYTSPDIKSDLSAPTAPTLTYTALVNSAATGNVVYYRSSAPSGSFTATALSTDTKSGIATFNFPALGTNWVSTPGALGVNTYSWSSTPQVPGAKSVTATNHATKTSSGVTFTPTADDTPPTAGTLAYADGSTSSTTVSLAFTTGTDGGSGLGTKLLQRAAAPLTEGECGAYTDFATVFGGANPATSPLVDSVTQDYCYVYQYVVPDRVGNVHIATSASVVKVTSSQVYYDAINGTAGLLNYFRLGEPTIATDTFAGTTAATLQSRIGEGGAWWTKQAASTTDAVITLAGRIRKTGTTAVGASYYSSADPGSADYRVEADVNFLSAVPNTVVGVTGRVDNTISASTYYSASYEAATLKWKIHSVMNGTKVELGASPGTQTLLVGTPYRLALDMSDSTIRLLVNGTELVNVDSTTITDAGRAGVVLGFGAAGTTHIDTTGIHLDNFQVTPNELPRISDAKGTNVGDYMNGVMLGQAGAVAGVSSTAAFFDGINDYGSVERQVSDDLSVEFWFKSTQGIGVGPNWWEGAALVDSSVAAVANDFGVSLRSDGKIVAGVGSPDVSIVSTNGAYNNGVWHHVVFTRVMATGAMELYVDGVSAGSATGSTVPLTSSATMTFGRNAAGSKFYLGRLDEIAIYEVPLSPGTVLAHYNAGL